MPTNKHLFMDDLKGVNGKVAQELVYAEVEKYLEFDLSVSEVEDLIAIEESFEEKEAEIEELEEENEKLKEKIKSLQYANFLLKKENFDIGNIHDDIVIKNKNPFTENLGMKQ